MRAPADSYWSIDECRWVRYTGVLEIPDQRDAEAEAEQPADEATPALAGSRDDAHR